MQHNKQNYSGFTLVELLIITPMVLLIIASFVVVIVSLTGDALANREQLVQARDTQDALDRIEQDIRLSNRFLAENRVVLTSPQGVNNDTTKFVNVSATTGTALILQSLATDKNPIDNTRNLVFLTNSPNACNSPLVTSNSPSYVNIVYFVKNNMLYRRVLTTYNPSPVPCVTPWQQSTCAAGQVNGTSCKSEDTILAKDVASISIDYFTTPTSTTPIADASSAATTVAVRDAALVTASSLRASITLTKSASGRDVTYSGAARVSKLNSSTLEPPTVPVVTNFMSGPTSVTFSWDGIASATSYVVSYSINGGAYIDVPNGVTSPSYTVTASRNDVVAIKVAANNATGTSANGTSTANIPAWATCNLQNNWTNYGGTHATAEFTKTTSGVVMLKGLIKDGSTVLGDTICTLPPGYRPSERLLFSVAMGGTIVGRVDIDTSGNVVYLYGNNSWLSLSTISFIPAGTYSWTTMTGLNSWLHYDTTGDTAYPAVQVTKDSTGRAHIQGLARAGTTSLNTNAFALPANYAPATNRQDIYAVGGSGGTSTSMVPNSFQLTPGGYIQTRGVPQNGYWANQAMFYPSAVTGFTAATMQNSWNPTYGAPFSPAEYKKSSDDIVSLRGLPAGGTATVGTTLFTLPVGSRPSEIIICDATTGPGSGVYARVDINPNGAVTVREGGNTAWLSLAGCDFMAEQ